MSNSQLPEDLAWLRQHAAVGGNTYAQVLLHLLERVEALEARPIPGRVELAAPTRPLQPLSAAAALRAICDLGRQHGAAQPAPPTAPAGRLVERVAAAMDPRYPKAFRGEARPAIREVAAWLDQQGQHGCSLLLREGAGQ